MRMNEKTEERIWEIVNTAISHEFFFNNRVEKAAERIANEKIAEYKQEVEEEKRFKDFREWIEEHYKEGDILQVDESVWQVDDVFNSKDNDFLILCTSVKDKSFIKQRDVFYVFDITDTGEKYHIFSGRELFEKKKRNPLSPVLFYPATKSRKNT